jgi:ribonuclease PH
MSWQRPDGRQPHQLRPIKFERGFTQSTPGSVLAHCGNTKVLCTVSIKRQDRELLKLSGRTQEIQRLIGRSLRAALDLSALGERTITVDADVLQADAGTRTTSITGGYVALVDAIQSLMTQGELTHSPIRHAVAAVSVGLLEGEAFLDLDYPEDVAASVDFNVVLTETLDILELQGTAEEGTFTRAQMNRMLDLAESGIGQLIEAQRSPNFSSAQG